MEGTRWKFGKWKEGGIKADVPEEALIYSVAADITLQRTGAHTCTYRVTEYKYSICTYKTLRLVDIHTITSSDLQQPMTGQSFSPYLYDARHAGLGEVESNR